MDSSLFHRFARRLIRTAWLASSVLVLALTHASPSSASTLAFVSNAGSNSVSVIDTSSQHIDTIPVGLEPTGIAATSDGAFVWIANSGSDNISVIQVATKQVIRTISVGSRPSAIAISPDNATVYVANSGDSSVSIINASTFQVSATLTTGFLFPAIGPAPFFGDPALQLGITPDGRYVFVPNTLAGFRPVSVSLSVIDTANNNLVSYTPPLSSINNPGWTLAGGIAIAPDGKTGYATAWFGYIEAFDTQTWVEKSAVSLSGGASGISLAGIAITPNQQQLIVAAEEHNSVYLVNTSDYSSVEVPVGNGPVSVAVTPDGAYAYVTNAQDTTVSVVDIAHQYVVATIGVGVNPFGVAFARQGTTHIQPQAYTGDYYILHGSSFEHHVGSATVTLLAGTYYFDVESNGRFSFDVDADGIVSNISNPAAAYAIGDTLFLNNTTVEVEPEQYHGLYFLSGYGNTPATGTHSFTVVPTLPLFFDNWSGGRVLFDIDGSGTISGISNPNAAFSSGNVLYLNNTSISVDPQLYSGSYVISGFDNSPTSGLATFTVVPNLPVYFKNYAGDYFSMFVNADGTLTNVGNAVAGQAFGSRLQLSNACVRLNPGVYNGVYYLPSFPTTSFSGTADVELIAGMSYYLIGSTQTFIVNPDGSTSLATVPVSVDSQTYAFNVGPGACDTTAPSTVAGGAFGTWQNQNVTLTLTATDNAGGSGVRSITYSASGATTIAQQTVAGAGTSFVIANEGVTNVTFSAVDNAGNQEPAHSVAVMIDKTGPLAGCSNGPSGWTASDVTVTCTPSDSLSGLTSDVPITFSLSTHVAAGTATSSATTDSRSICDLAGNCVSAGPYTFEVDKAAPLITISAPTNTTYVLHQNVTASYSCSDLGSGIQSCAGPVASGSPLPTSMPGPQTFAVTASDRVGNSSSASVSYSITYGTIALYDQTKAVKSGAVVPLKVELVDSTNVNQSSAAITVTAVQLVYASTNATGDLEDAGNANPDSDFRYDATLGGYIFNLATSGLQIGTWQLLFRAGSDPTLHTVSFQVR